MTFDLEFYKETKNKFRWLLESPDLYFSVYIPKWRLPEPPPSTIHVSIISKKDVPENPIHVTANEIAINPELVQESIIAEITPKEELTRTIRFDPVGDPENHEIGSPYISKHLFNAELDESIWILIRWET